MKTEHNGPKRGRGEWCSKADAKGMSKRYRRIEDARLAREAQAMTFDEMVEDCMRRYPKVLAYLAKGPDQ